MTHLQTLQVDIAILGGGIAGLWLLNRVRNAGYSAVLFEQQALGSGQTVASQGMIHGGVKYTLGGALSGASEAIADMPAHWRRCIAGEGDVDLRGTRILSDHFYMWSSQGVMSKATAFLASKSLRGRVDALKPRDYPPVFRDKAFKGSLYKLVDMVIDTPSLLETLRLPVADRIVAIDWARDRLQRSANGVQIACGDVLIDSQCCVLAAGKGNGDLLQKLDVKNPVMQVRPLQQVMVRHKQLYDLYAHCVGTDSKPRLTISSHRDGDSMVWYLGGQLAEDGVLCSSDELIRRAQQELATLFPWLDWQGAEWATLHVDRAEPSQPGLLRPDNAWLSACEGLSRCLVAWPTKLTLVPNLGNLLMERLKQDGIVPVHAHSPLPAVLPRLSRIADAPWHVAPWQRI